MEGAASIASESFPSVEAGTSPRCLGSVAHTRPGAGISRGRKGPRRGAPLGGSLRGGGTQRGGESEPHTMHFPAWLQ